MEPWILLYLAMVLLAGYVATSAILGPGRRNAAELLGLMLALGLGMVSTVLLWASLVGVRSSRGLIWAILGMSAAGLAWLGRRRRLVIPSRPGRWRATDALALLPAALMGFLLLVIFVHALAYPLFDWDGFAIWGLKAKVLFYESLWQRPEAFFQPTLSFSHQDYPPLVPFMMASVYAAIGRVNDYAGKLPLPLLYAAMGLLMYGGLRKDLGRLASAMLAGILLALPPIIRSAGTGCADVPLAAFYAGSVLYLSRWARDQGRESLILATLFSIFAALTKNEGMALALINAMVAGGVWLWRVGRAWRWRLGRLAPEGWLAAVACIVLGLLPWLVFRQSLPRTHEDYGSKFTMSRIADNVSRLQIILPELRDQITTWREWGPLWLVLMLAAIAGWRAFLSPRGVVLWVLFAAHVALYVLVYLVTPWSVRELLDRTLDRLLLHVTPVAVLLIGAHWAAASPAPMAGRVETAASIR